MALLGVALANPTIAQETPSPTLVEFKVGDRPQQGLRLVDTESESVVIGRDGWLHAIESTNASIRPIDGRYQPISAPELRNQLRAEFGSEFEVLATSNFLVVQPRGRGRGWPDLFEQAHRAFTSYMSKRDVRIRQGRFPMVAVVFPDSSSMYAEFSRQDLDVSRVAGLYSNSSNRVMTHDGGRRAAIAATVRHEAAHQSAFNSGVHSRVNDTPQWIIEGIGQMFEPNAMAEYRSGSRWIDRVNRDSVRVLRRLLSDRGEDVFLRDVSQLVRDDRLFNDPVRIDDAYALAWAMMFFLGERQPDVFADVLNFTATRPPFVTYDAGQRQADFERIVGRDPLEFAKQLQWFVESIR